MGLQERRLVHQLQTEILPGYQMLLRQRSGGADVRWVVDWDSFAECDRAALEKVEPLAFQTVVEAIAAICVDDFGIETVKSEFKEVRLKHDRIPETVSIAFVNGMLNFRADFSQVSATDISADGVREAIENGM